MEDGTIRRHLTPEGVLNSLLKEGLIDKPQAERVLRDYPPALERLKRLNTVRSASFRQTYLPPIDAIDVIVSMQIKRADHPDLFLDEEIIYRCLAKEWGIPFYKPDPLKLNLDVVTGIIPYQFALKHLLLVIDSKDGNLYVATPYPFNQTAKEDLQKVTQQKVNLLVTPKKDVLKTLNEFYLFRKYISQAEGQANATMGNVDIGNLEQFVVVKGIQESDVEDQYVVKAVDHLLTYALDNRASDIHIEPKRDKSVVRLRIDGVLHKIYDLPKKIHPAISNRIKNMARMDMAEKRRPQDGRIKMAKDGREIEVRVSSVPVAFGEKLVLRLQSPEILYQDLESLGMTPEDLLRYKQAISLPYGMVLVCGPTGSGKTTTLYSTLKYLHSPEVNITTIEDPIELVDEAFNQIAVQPQIGLSFSSALRHILRQDPDVIMVGEIRDRETAENAIQAALTGHLVFSTLHTNDAPSAIIRLLDLGVQSYLIKAVLNASVAQRLLRKVCPYCAESFHMDAEELNGLGLKTGKKGMLELKRGKGCHRCRGTGYLGRIGVFEVMLVDEPIKNGIDNAPDHLSLKNLAQRQGMTTLFQNALKVLLEGKTTYQEVIRVTFEGQ
jgi:general secretion pathway protein E